MRFIHFFIPFLFASMSFLSIRAAQSAPQKAANPEIVFVGRTPQGWDLFLCDRKGKNARRLTKTPFDERQPRWSHDGRRIVYAASDGRIRILEWQTGKVTILPTGKNRCSSPCFSPDDTAVVYSQMYASSKEDTDLFTIRIAGGRTRQLTFSRTIQLYPAWSQTGQSTGWLRRRNSRTERRARRTRSV